MPKSQFAPRWKKLKIDKFIDKINLTGCSARSGSSRNYWKIHWAPEGKSWEATINSYQSHWKQNLKFGNFENWKKKIWIS